jgi:hypothetical protein
MSTGTKKRKRDEVEEKDQEQITFSVLDHSPSSVGPVLGESTFDSISLVSLQRVV